MALETTPLGFKKPDGRELIRNMDNVISENAQKTQDLFGQVIPQIDALLDTVAGFGPQSDAKYVPLSRGQLPANTNLDALTGNEHVGSYGISSTGIYQNAPAISAAGVLEVVRGSGNALGVVQRVTSGTQLFWREAVDTATNRWSEWVQAETPDGAQAKVAAAEESAANYTDEQVATRETPAGAQSKADTAAGGALTAAKTYTDAETAKDRTRLTSVESTNADQGNRLTDVETKVDDTVPTWDVPGIAAAIVAEGGASTWLQANDVDGGPTIEAEGAIRGAVGQTLTDTPGVSVMITANGSPTWLQANNTDGGPTPEALSFFPQPPAPTPTAVAEITLPPERNFTISTVDGPHKLRSDQAVVVGYGDSHMLGGPVFSTRWMSILGTKLPAANVVNLGAGGNTSDLVAVRAGAICPRLTFDGGSIPASGPVAVAFTDPISYRNTGTFSVAGTVAGVAGTLARTNLYELTFTRAADGAAVTTGPTEFVSNNYATYHGAVQIILAGRNDVAPDVALSNGEAPLSDAIDRAVSAQVAIVESQSPLIKKTLILGALTDVSFVRGTVGYELATGINQELQRIYPNYYWDLRGYLAHQCIYDLGITPTEADLTAMAGDTLPPSIMLEDNIHFGVAAHTKVADQVYAQLIARKLVNP